MAIDLGKIAWTNGGEYDPTTLYEIYTVVTYNGSSYVSIVDGIIGIDPTNREYWQLLARKGDRGEQGETGPSGRGISSIYKLSGTGAPGTVDVYRIIFTDGSDFDFAIYNGKDGTSFRILGVYPTLEELQIAVPTPIIGDSYFVGAEAPYDVYTWTGSEWLNLGPLQGPEGPQGPQGEKGEKGDKGDDGRGIVSIERTSGTGAAGTYDTYTISFTDGSTTTYQVYNGKDGAKGDKGDPGPNEISSETATEYNGLLKGDGEKVVVAEAGTDYATPSNVADAISDHDSDGSAHSEKFNAKESLLKNLTFKANIVDNDSFAMVDSQASDASKRTLWSTIKATLKAYFDGLYNNYTHPTGDGNLHVPATGTTNNGKVLKAGATAGSISWGTLTAADVGAATTSDISSAINTHDGNSSAHSAQFGAKLDKSGGTMTGMLTLHDDPSQPMHAATKQYVDSKTSIFNVTLDTSWTGSSAPYSKTVTVTGILETDTPIIDVVMSGTYATDKARQEAWAYIYRAVTSNNSITFYASEKPTVDLPVQIKVVR